MQILKELRVGCGSSGMGTLPLAQLLQAQGPSQQARPACPWGDGREWQLANELHRR